MTAVLFEVQGNDFVPTPLAGSPWHPEVLHGGAPAGLLAHCLEQQVAGLQLLPARLSIDLIRPVPGTPLQVEVSPVRAGKRIALLQAKLTAGGSLVAVASGLFVKPEPLPLPAYAPRHQATLPSPDGLDTVSFGDILFGQSGNPPPGLHTTVQLRPISGLDETGRGSAWIRLPALVIDGQPNTPFMLAALAADFGNGVGQLSLGDQVGTINADIQLHLGRLPQGEWIGLQSEALLDETGVGQVLTVLHDGGGRVGQVTQTIMPMRGFGGTN
ncbi:thioesterase family protein [Ketobacter sp.]|uniref:thioesterase family protein n=1 Tax=Ketobacter sp. TaxID=2083498 RepID=UPI000F19945E|nr:thioesterase family protein [Ketobacter sp.]RLT92540.1 MAG: thioesterase family protein [Ketobacter sp.]